ncbi:hypothetical protein QBC36DRAFT_316262 [Triangularia setosa]|uniref:Uncharacterized protein n=1 Tax=Triangularia setosa TaxID=2587417 RepID=A0AAN6VXB3_9PEZI|nr:hypothetical protein QBC36DRAFT_316262 [Podospora setosa]
MAKFLDNFIAPCLISFPTDTISCCYIGPRAERQRPHHMTVCRRLLQEDDIPHCTARSTSAMTTPSSIAWRIHFSKKHLDAVRYILSQVRPLTVNVLSQNLCTFHPEPRHALLLPLRHLDALTNPPRSRRCRQVAKPPSRWMLLLPDPHQRQVGSGLAREYPGKDPRGGTGRRNINRHQRTREVARALQEQGPIPSASSIPIRSINKNGIPRPFYEDEEFYETVDAAPSKESYDYPKLKPQPPTPTPVRNHRTTYDDAFADSPVGKPGQMALRNKGLLSIAANNERKVSTQGMLNNRPITMEFGPKYASTVLKGIVIVKDTVPGSPTHDHT